MTAATRAVPATRGWILVLAGGVLAGTLDIVYAFVFWAIKAGVAPGRILQNVASGLLGPASFAGGAATVALGMALQWLIAVCMAVAYYVAARRWPVLARRWLRYGALYGLLMYALMNFVVVPLSAARPGSRDPTWVALTVVAHVVLIGIPIAWFTRQAMAAPAAARFTGAP